MNTKMTQVLPKTPDNSIHNKNDNLVGCCIISCPDGYTNDSVNEYSFHRGILRVTTLEESLHIPYGSSHSRKMCRSELLKDDSMTSSTRSERSVSFHRINVREYKSIVGDNPSVTNGPPIQLGWDFKEGIELEVESYEQEKGPPKDMLALVLPRKEREDRLMDSGHTRKEISDAIREVKVSKNQRRTTVNNLEDDHCIVPKIEEIVQSAKRKFGRFVLFKKKDSALYDKWKKDFETAQNVLRQRQMEEAMQDEKEHYQPQPTPNNQTLRKTSHTIVAEE